MPKSIMRGAGPLYPVLAAFIVLALFYRHTVPLFETPDEPSHIEYLAFLNVHKRLPRYSGTVEVPGEGIQAPLYYCLLSPLFAAVVKDAPALLNSLHLVDLTIYHHDKNAIYKSKLVRPLRRTAATKGLAHFEKHPHLSNLLWLRWPSLFFGILAVILTFLAARTAAGDARLAALAAAIVGLNPQFLFLTGSVSPDAAATALGAAGLWLAAAAVCGKSAGPHRRDYLLLGILTGVGILLKKPTLVGLAALWALFLTVDRRPLSARLRDAGLAGTAMLVLAGPFLIWNVTHQGDLLGSDAFAAYMKRFPGTADFGGPWKYFTGTYWVWTFSSYWARFGWMHVFPPQPVIWTYLILCGGSAAGFALACRAPKSASWRPIRYFLPAVVLLTVAGHAWVNLSIAQAQGRHLFPAAPHHALIFAIGFTHFFPKARKDSETAFWAVLISLAALAVYCLTGVLVPAYNP